MKILSKLSRKVSSFTSYIEDYKLLQVRLEGGIPTLYQELDLPWFRDLGISTVLDIGANIGQSTITLNKLLPDAQIYAFEPIPDCFSQLEHRFNGCGNVKTINLGLGAESGEITFEKNSYSPSSSFLKMTDTHKKAFPFTEKSEEIKVQIERLDDVVGSLELKEPIMAKIDVQGFEDKVIAGGQETLKRCQIVILETSFVTLYEDQPLFHDIYQLMVNIGFHYAGSVGHLLDPHTKKCLQSDILFIRTR